MRRIARTIITMLMLICTLAVHAQGGQSTIGETMRSNGRIYVVIAVILTILFGIFIYIIRLDRKIAKMEKESSRV